MSTAWIDIGTALTQIVQELDITPVVATGWSLIANYPLKPPIAGWPVVAIVPAQGVEQDLSNMEDAVACEWWIVLFYSYEQAATAEDKTRQLADLLVSRLRPERLGKPPLGVASAYAITAMSQAWDFDVEHGLRYYRLSLTVMVTEPLTA